ncbi:MAG: DUF2071 domain-containing protein [Acidobacteriota bacterium]|nr:DUF2071 domain-containing protein [Acidobacteriota bacterium]MDH3524142.1 DUF2071 domain-containing protein [Acidobacteriota bacterium]
MQLRTTVRDCLYVNWAVPRERLPRLPEGLRYEWHAAGGERLGLVSALLFHQHGLRSAAMPWARLSYPQFNLRTYVLDDEGVPAVHFGALMVPGWVLPFARAAGQPELERGRFLYPRPSRDRGAESWTWRASARGAFAVTASQSAPRVGTGPDLGSWQRTCDHIRRRDRGYVEVAGRLRRIETTHGATTVWPMAARVTEESLLRRLFGWREGDWPEVHSAWLCPEVPLSFELARAERAALPSSVPATG